MNIFIAGITSDIGQYICEQFLQGEGNKVIGTYRKQPDDSLRNKILKNEGILYPCDFNKRADIDRTISNFLDLGIRWDIVISAVGVMSPIGYFADIDIEKWEDNVYTNAMSQVRLLHGILGCRNKNASVYFMTSKGINDPFPLHSSYCLSKIVLVKICELLDDEIGDCKFIAFNPGFINTKIIQQEGNGYVVREENSAVALNRVWRFIRWSHGQDKRIVSGRNFFVKYDRWEDESIVRELLEEKNDYKLRRCGDTWFLKEEE